MNQRNDTFTCSGNETNNQKLNDICPEYYYEKKYTATFSHPIERSNYYEEVLNNLQFIIEEAKYDATPWQTDEDIYITLNFFSLDKCQKFHNHVLFPLYREPWKLEFAPIFAEKFSKKKI